MHIILTSHHVPSSQGSFQLFNVCETISVNQLKCWEEPRARLPVCVVQLISDFDWTTGVLQPQ